MRSAFKTAPFLLLDLQSLRIKDRIVQKFGQGHMKALCKHHHGAQRNGLVPSVHNTLHTSVLNARFLLKTVLGHILFLQ